MPLNPSVDFLLRLQHGFGDSQWWPAERLQAYQMQALTRLVEHAHAHAPMQRARLDEAGFVPGEPLLPAVWQRLPLLTRREVQAHVQALASREVPPSHGAVVTNASSGSTGVPVEVLGTEYDALLCKALMFRTFLWHDYDFTRKYAAIRKLRLGQAPYPEGIDCSSWGDSATFPLQTGPACLLNIDASADQQLEWMRRQEPTYLTTYPSLLRSLLVESERAGVGAPRLLKVMCTGESMPEDLPEQCAEQWGAEVLNVYSAMEIDQIAAQCPEHPHLHVQAERLLVEILREDGSACAPGETGRVVVTPLFNFAMPLLRYALGDYAEVGEPCVCGRGLPVLRRVHGRVRNTLITPDGARHWPNFGTKSFRRLAPVIQHQFVQTAPDRLECRFVVERPLRADEEAALLDKVRSRLPCAFHLTATYPDAIARSASGKYEDFYSELPV